MSNSNHPILKLLRKKQNVDNNECQAFQKELRLIFDEIWETQINEESKQLFKEKVEDCLIDYSSTVNNLDFQYYTEIRNILIKKHNEEAGQIHDSERLQKKHLHSPMQNSHKSKPSNVLFECNICDSKFSSKSSLKDHKDGAHKPVYANEDHHDASDEETDVTMDSEQDADINKCEICGDTFASYRGLKNHLLLHSDERNFICPYCHKGFVVKNRWRLHITNVEKKNPYKCHKCNTQFRTKRDLKCHQEEQHASEAKSDEDWKECDKCNASFIESELAQHKQWVHGERVVNKDIEEHENHTKVQESNGSIEDIKREMHLGSESKGDNDSNGAASAQSVHKHDPSKLLCICRKPYNGATDLIQCNDCQEFYHLSCIGISRNKLEPWKFKCPACNMNMDEHLDTNNHKCLRCPYTTKSSKDLCKHISMLHKSLEQEMIKEKLITICNYCNKTHFIYDRHACPTNIKKWWRSKEPSTASDEETNSESDHNDNDSDSISRPFKCDYEDCDRDYTAQCYLNDHIRKVHHGKPYKCDECNQKFAYSAELDCHRLQHRLILDVPVLDKIPDQSEHKSKEQENTTDSTKHISPSQSNERKRPRKISDTNQFSVKRSRNMFTRQNFDL